MIAVAVGLIALFLVFLYGFGGDHVVMSWALEGQRAAQTEMARDLRALRMGDHAALLALLAVCFGYGFFHAVGPGHGKVLIGGYGAAAQVGAVKLSVIALLSSLAQAVTAVALVSVGLWIVGWSRVFMTDLAERLLTPLSFAAIGLIGVWLIARGVRNMARLRHRDDAHTPGHQGQSGEHHAHICHDCGHAHAPDPHQITRAKGWKDLIVMILAIGIRPCAGALFLLILTAQMGLFGAGVLGAFVMALGTASVTILVAVLAVTLRRGALGYVANIGVLRHVPPILEVTIGFVVFWVALQTVFRLI
jgi:ABC-type nickel/cobalt efflux system permease component RcnA